MSNLKLFRYFPPFGISISLTWLLVLAEAKKVIAGNHFHSNAKQFHKYYRAILVIEGRLPLMTGTVTPCR